jgi:hypothetical protein
MAVPPVVTATLYVGDEDVTDRVVWTQTSFQTVAAAQPGTCQITLREQGSGRPPPSTGTGNPLSPAIVDNLGDLIRLYLNGELSWIGYLFTMEWGYWFGDDPDDRKWVLSGVDLNILYDKLILWNHSHPTRSLDGAGTYKRVKTEGGYIVTVPRHTYDREYIKAMLQDTDIGLLYPAINITNKISQVGQINPDGEFAPPTPGLTLRAFMQDVSNNVQRSTPGSTIWYIDTDGYYVYQEQDTDTAAFSVGDTDPGSNVMIKSLRLSQDISRIKNDVLIFTGNLDPRPEATQDKLLYSHQQNADSVSNYGRFQFSEVLTTSWLQGSVNARAGKILTQEGVPAGRAEFTTYQPGLKPGQIVTIDSQSHGILENYPIRAISMNWVTPTTVEYRVTCSYDTQDPWGLLLALKRPPQRGLTQPPFQVIDLTSGGTVEPAETYTLVKEYPRAMNGARWQCSYAYIRFSMVVIVNGLRKVSVPEEGTTVGFIEVDPDNGIFFMDAPGFPYVEYHVWHNLDNQ